MISGSAAARTCLRFPMHKHYRLFFEVFSLEAFHVADGSVVVDRGQGGRMETILAQIMMTVDIPCTHKQTHSRTNTHAHSRHNFHLMIMTIMSNNNEALTTSRNNNRHH